MFKRPFSNSKKLNLKWDLSLKKETKKFEATFRLKEFLKEEMQEEHVSKNKC